ncbi:MAG: hypothetical protein KGN79_02325 [Acidobacteriota bacterium]|nr:hypothetical protein [Acidobacteriota bacterium]
MDEQSESNFQPMAPDNLPPLEPELPEHPRPRIPFVLIGFVILALLAVIALVAMWPKKSETVQAADDLGPGVYNPAGLRGHLTIQWEGRARYRLQIEPLNDTLADGFAYVAGTPDQPYALTIRVLDNAGFALCSKEILFPFDPEKALAAQASADLKNAGRRSAGQIARELAQQRANLDQLKQQETQREIGKDIFQPVVDPNGKVIAVQALGDLPCSVDAYKRAYIWDFTTNFPTPDEQDALLHHLPNAIEEIQARSQRAASAAAARRKAAAKPYPSFFVEGDDRITDYDVGNAVLSTSMRKAFAIGRRAEQVTAQNWADDSALIHYKCDSFSNCTLSRSGSAAVLHAHMIR